MISVDELKRALKITASTRDDDLKMCADAAVEWFSSQTSVYFGTPRNSQLRYDGTGISDVIYLNAPPAVAPVVYLWNGTGWVLATGWEMDGARIIMLNGAYWPYGRRNIRVDVAEGYEPGEGPAEVRRAMLAVAVAMWKEQESGNVQSESIGGYSYALRAPGELPTFVKQAVGRYRRVRV